MLNFDEITDKQLKSVNINGTVYQEYLIETKIDEHNTYTEKVLANCTDAPELSVNKEESISINILTNVYETYQSDFSPKFYRIDIDKNSTKIRVKGNGI